MRRRLLYFPGGGAVETDAREDVTTADRAPSTERGLLDADVYKYRCMCSVSILMTNNTDRSKSTMYFEKYVSGFKRQAKFS